MVLLRDKLEIVKVKDLVPYDRNPNLHSENQIELLAKNIEAYGFDQPIVIDEYNVIIKGHGRRLALLKLNWDEVPCIRVEGLSEAHKQALRLSDNALQNLSEWDETQLQELLKEIQSEIDITTLGFEEELLKININDEKEFDENLETKNQCPSCGYEW